MKRLGIPETFLLNVKLRVPAILKSVLGLGFIILIYTCISGIYINNVIAKETYIASIFGHDFASNRIIKPNIAMYTLRNYNTHTFSNPVDDLSAWYQRGETTKCTKNSQFAFKKIVSDDEYKTGAQFVMINEQFVFMVIVDNSYDSKVQAKIDYVKSEILPSELKVYGRDCKNWKDNFIVQEEK